MVTGHCPRRILGGRGGAGLDKYPLRGTSRERKSPDALSLHDRQLLILLQRVQERAICSKDGGFWIICFCPPPPDVIAC
ncbi:hypothetical protein CEXT_693471 [Caerostris extrusa]|uniref:Uncharacterized protein n=1 Tax=Caerostris extrusa TaxID=172846 RepID=A0AAV4MFF7_CAEEX|nr:hypothetical protein CEXT_693471 [Caerostris extrusa]